MSGNQKASLHVTTESQLITAKRDGLMPVPPTKYLLDSENFAKPGGNQPSPTLAEEISNFLSVQQAEQDSLAVASHPIF